MIPSFIYGTAWKKEATTDLVRKALRSGFHAVDTANQAKHYSEALAGEALTGVPRETIWLQTKFTSLNGQDHRLPYDPDAGITTQVHQSFESSLQHLKTDYLDSYLLHGPYNYPGLGKEDWEVWGAVEEIHRSGRARTIGISNVNAGQLSLLVEKAAIKPMAVQNRCYANRGWDREVRQICRANGIMYQGFSLLTANPYLLNHPPIVSMAQRLGVHPEQVVFRFAMQVGMVPLTGTTDEVHMREDLRALTIELTDGEVDFIESIAG